jgi:hypothetical protein
MDEQTAIEILQKRREGDKARSKKWQQKQIKEGKKHLSCMISSEAHGLLMDERDKSQTTIPEVIERALMGQYASSTVDLILDDPGPIESENLSLKIDELDNMLAVDKIDAPPDLIPQGDTPAPDETQEIPDCHGKELTTDERDKMLVKVGMLYPGPNNAQRRADLLNKAGVPIKGKPVEWTKKSAGDNIRLAKGRLNKK